MLALLILSQINIDKPPSIAPEASWASYLFYLLAILSTVALGYLVLAVKAKEATVSEQTAGMVEYLKKTIEMLSQQNASQLKEHTEDREAMTGVKNVLVEMTHEIRSLGEKVDRNGGHR